jgi:hypothetical protein
MTKGKSGVEDLLDARGDLFPSLGRFARKGKGERIGLAWLMLAWPNSKIQILNVSPFKKSLKTHHLGFPRFPDMTSKLWPKFGDF